METNYSEDFNSTESSKAEDTSLLGEDVEMTVQELYAQLLLADELLITVESHSADDIKAALISIKAKENAKLKNKGMPVDNSKLNVVIVRDPELAEGFTKLHLTLIKRKTFAIAKIESPSNDL